MLTIFYAWGLVTVQYKYFPYSYIVTIKSKLTGSKTNNNEANEAHEKWANEIKNGNYTLYFRHSHRNKIDTIIAHDILELLNANHIEGSSCLSSQGKKDAKLVGQIFAKIEMQVGTIISSPICRSKEMAEIAFGRIDVVDYSFIYRPLLNEREYKLHSEKIKKALIKYEPKNKNNTIITAHASTLEFYCEYIFDSCDKIKVSKIDESGFYVIKNEDGKLLLKHIFKSFSDFVIGLNLSTEFFVEK